MRYATPEQLAYNINAPVPLTGAILEAAERALDVASAQVDGVCGTTFQAGSQARIFSPLTASIIKLGFANDITLVEVDLDGDGTFETTIPSTAYYTTGEHQKYLVLRTNSGFGFRGLMATRVTATFGLADIPPAVELATILQAARLYMRKSAVFGVMQNEEMGNMRIPSGFDKDALQILKDAGLVKPRGRVLV